MNFKCDGIQRSVLIDHAQILITMCNVNLQLDISRCKTIVIIVSDEMYLDVAGTSIG
jgi:hypothetical protein